MKDVHRGDKEKYNVRMPSVCIMVVARLLHKLHGLEVEVLRGALPHRHVVMDARGAVVGVVHQLRGAPEEGKELTEGPREEEVDGKRISAFGNLQFFRIR